MIHCYSVERWAAAAEITATETLEDTNFDVVSNLPYHSIGTLKKDSNIGLMCQSKLRLLPGSKAILQPR